MIKVSVHSAYVRDQSGIGKASGKPYSMSFQEVWFHTIGKDGIPAPYPQRAEIILEKGQDGAALFYAAGEYQLHPSSVYMDRQGNPALSVRLVPLKQTPRAA